jgi:hypothetical protein
MARPKTKDPIVPLGKAQNETDRVLVQFAIPYGILLKVRQEAARRAMADPTDSPSVSDVLCDLVKAGLWKGSKR